ncbi:MAG: acetylxylan esterase [candidate division FCPU426 bacterium]
MAFFDLPLEQLKKYKSPDQAPDNFDAFWNSTLQAARRTPMKPEFLPLDNGLKFVETFDVTFPGFDGQPIKGWLSLPRQRGAKIPCIVEFIGYGGGRNFATEWLLWPNLGYAHFVMDTRGQGSTWSHGDTADSEPERSNPQAPGFMTRGIMDPSTYYYRRVFTDAARAVEAAMAHPSIDADRVAVTGGSQGGGISIAAAGLIPEVKAVIPDVPFLCHYRRATEISNSFPYAEISGFLVTHRDKVERVFSTLSYFDGVHFAGRSRCQALYSVGLMDTICPPSTVYAAYNAHQGPKDIRIWPYNQHEGGGAFQTQEKIAFVRSMWPV